ncbi:MAG: LL-diaminopimelate aminotransferase [Elusimicrobia bacterium RIFOXYA2_FULL_39_19]|nr:MAG: LL-diaminopimelate aminotransferase [Elusimicrobia bacterium RIFOXYA2_FULL_39_19]
MKYSNSVEKLPPYLFIEIDRKKKELLEKGVDIISFGVGDPDKPTPKHIIKACQKALLNPAYHQYPFGAGLKSFRHAIAGWFKTRFGVTLNPDTEIHSNIGSKEAIGHFPLAFLNPGDVVLVPEPGYPVYNSGTIFAGGTPYFMPLLEENNFLPDLSRIPEDICNKAKIMFINYPNNPTGAVATKEFFKEVVAFAKKYSIIVAHDAAYSEMFYDKTKAPVSFLSVPGAMDIGVEFHSFSKTFNMTGWRLGWVCGNADIIKGFSKVKDNYDSGVFSAIQEAGVVALKSSQKCVENARKMYKQRRDVLVNGLSKVGFKVKKPQATFYVWAGVPQGYTSAQTTEKLLTEAGIVTTPGNGMGKSGEGYVRFVITQDVKRIKEALERMKKLTW